MIRNLVLLSGIIICCIPNVFTQTTKWVKSAGGVGSEKGITIGVDAQGFVYIGGYFNGTANFGPHVVNSAHATDKDIFVAKLDTNGNFLWATSAGGGIDDRLLGMHVDPAGIVYATGTFWGSATFGPHFLSAGPNGGYDDSWLAKMDNNGNWLWVKTFGAPSITFEYPVWIGDDHGYDVETDANDNIYITGWWSGPTAYFDSFTLTNPKWTSDTMCAGYVGKMDPSGNFLWVKMFDGVDDLRGERDNRMAVDNAGNVFVTGGFEKTGNYGPFTLTSNGSWDIFVTKLNTNGDFQWASRAGSNKGDRGNGIAVDSNGDVYVSGEYRNKADFGPDSLKHKKRKDIFVAKMDANGNWLWSSRARSSSKDKANQMHVDANFNSFVCGEIGDTTKFGSIKLFNADSANAFAGQLSASGKWLWAKQGGSISNKERSNDIVVDKWGNSYIIGFYEGNANFDGHTISSLGKKDIFIWKIDKYIAPDEPLPPDPGLPIPTGIKGAHVPQAFSPNQDGNNDILFVYGGQIVDIQFQIYDRWGEMVFSTNDPFEGWDGTFNGKSCSSGVYVYMARVTYFDGDLETITGNVTLVR